MIACSVCGGRLRVFAAGNVLQRDVQYHRCAACGGVFLLQPNWLDEAYSSAISALDVGLLQRCLQLANVTAAVVGAAGLRDGTFLDFAGGYGTLTRLLRDRGYDFRHHDPLCENIFAPGLEGDLTDHYDLVTAFEVLEHLVDPVVTLTPVAKATDLLLLTTQVLPQPAPAPADWDYYAPETGQHVSFFTVETLRALAGRLDMQVTTAGHLVHLFHRGPLPTRVRLLLRDARLAYLIGALGAVRPRRSLTLLDAGQAAARVTVAGQPTKL